MADENACFFTLETLDSSPLDAWFSTSA